MKKMNKKGFTLAELLIVVAIIAVLVAIAIPVFTAQLEKSRQAATLANLRSGYAEATVSLLEQDLSGNSVTVEEDVNITTKSSSLDKIDADELSLVPFTVTLPGATGKTTMNYTFTLDSEGKVTACAVAKKG